MYIVRASQETLLSELKQVHELFYHWRCHDFNTVETGYIVPAYKVK